MMKPNHPSAESKKRHEVAAMFDDIAPTYDRLNRILSVGTDRIWRNRAIRHGGVTAGQHWLDLAAGSGDVAQTGLRLVPGSQWTAGDPSMELLRILKNRPALTSVNAYLCGAEQLPFEDASFDGVTVAFGLRNFERPMEGLAEIHRVLKPGGKAVILEFLAQESGGWGGPLVRFYLEKVLPLIGGLVSGHKHAYSYLAQSSKSFWSPTQLKNHLNDVGYGPIKMIGYMGGAVTLTIAQVDKR